MSALDRLLDEAREAEPEPLDEVATEALVQAARRESEAPTSRLDGLVKGARHAAPDSLSELEVRRIVQRAAVTGGARHRSWTRRRVMMAAGVTAAVAAAVVTFAFLPPSPVPEAPGPTVAREPAPEENAETAEPTDLELETGDRILAAAGSRFHVEVPEESERSVRLDSGTMLFDVRPIEGGRFSVVTPNAEVVVLGTVFTVHTSASGTTVRVYEGRVEVRGDEARIVTAGHTAHLGDGTPVPDALESRAEDAASARLAVVDETLDLGMADRPAAGQEQGAEARAEVTAVDAPTEGATGRGPTPANRRATFSEARGWIANGEAERALLVAEQATSAGDVDPWRMLEGDALRALGRRAEAAEVYRRAAAELPPPRREQAGFLEARLRAAELDDPTGALRALSDARVTGVGSPLRERGLSLEAGVLARLGRRDELIRVAALYLRDYPDGPRAAAMQTHLDDSRAAD